jgi:hypothetical protein
MVCKDEILTEGTAPIAGLADGLAAGSIRSDALLLLPSMPARSMSFGFVEAARQLKEGSGTARALHLVRFIEFNRQLRSDCYVSEGSRLCDNRSRLGR